MSSTLPDVGNIALIKLKRRIMMLVFFLRMFLIGVEYSIILPTALLYVKSLNGSYTSMGLVVSAYPLAGFITLPLFGYLYDQTLRVKELLFLLNLFQIVGNLVYSLHFSIAFPIIGRFIAGFGDGFSALAMGELSHLYSPSERIGMLSLLELGRVIGIIMGPTLNFLVAQKHFIVDGTWILDNKTLPGVIMAFSWSILQVCTVIGVFNLSRDIFIEKYSSVDNTLDYIADNNSVSTVGSDHLLDDDNISEALLYPDFSNGSDEMSNKSKLIDDNVPLTEIKVKKQDTKITNLSLREYLLQLKDAITFEFIALLYIEINLTVIQNVLEVLMPYITEFDYHWQPKQTGLVYVVAGFELLLIFLILYAVGSRFNINDAYLVVLTLVITQISLGLLIYEGVPESTNKRIIIFAVMVLCSIPAVPFNLVSMRSLLTKMFAPEAQGIIQGLYGSVSRIALVLAPIISSAIFEQRQMFGGIASVTNFAGLLIIFASLNRINKQQVKMHSKMMPGVDK